MCSVLPRRPPRGAPQRAPLSRLRPPQVNVAVEEGLIKEAMRDIIVVDADPVSLLRKLKAHRLSTETQLALDWAEGKPKAAFSL